MNLERFDLDKSTKNVLDLLGCKHLEDVLVLERSRVVKIFGESAWEPIRRIQIDCSQHSMRERDQVQAEAAIGVLNQILELNPDMEVRIENRKVVAKWRQ